ncbi:hypothetical protein FBU30_002673, partial [Linnemannia zychae]
MTPSNVYGKSPGRVSVIKQNQGMDLDNDSKATETQPQDTPQSEEVTQQPTPKEEVPFELHTKYTEFMIDYDKVVGDNTREKIINLNKAIEKEVSLVQPPFERTRRIDKDTQRFLVLRVGDALNTERLSLLAYDDNNQDPPVQIPFIMYTEAHQQMEESRQVDIRSLRGDTTVESIIGAFTPFGAVERVRIWPKTRNHRGTNIAATVSFESEEAVNDMKKTQVTTVYIGKDAGRITRLGTENIEYPKELEMKLTNLPFRTTALNLRRLYEEYKGCVVTVPYSIEKKSYSREAFVAFTTKEAKEAATARNLNINGAILRWVSVNEKCCHHCGDNDHLIANCRWATPRISNRPIRAAGGQTTRIDKYRGSTPKAVTTFNIEDNDRPSYSTMVTGTILGNKQNNNQENKQESKQE